MAIPDHILRKVGEGKITHAHFSDIIRVNLIAKYNAIWLDATIYLTAPLNWSAAPYHTLKWLSATGYPISFSGYSPVCKGQPGCLRWCGFCTGGNGGGLFSFMADVFSEYWEKEDVLIDYPLIDDVTELAYEMLPEVKKAIDAVPLCREHAWYFTRHFADTFDKEVIGKILSEQSIFKLTYKLSSCGIADPAALGENTLYRMIVDGTLLSSLGR